MVVISQVKQVIPHSMKLTIFEDTGGHNIEISMFTNVIDLGHTILLYVYAVFCSHTKVDHFVLWE